MILIAWLWGWMPPLPVFPPGGGGGTNFLRKDFVSGFLRKDSVSNFLRKSA